MSDFPNSDLAPLFISSFSLHFGPTHDLRSQAGGGGIAAQTWVANLAIYVPISLPFPYPLRRLWWTNGSTLTSSHADVGIYSVGGAKIVSAGSTVMSGASAPQFVTPSPDLLLPPGRYYLGFSCDSTTSRVGGSATWSVLQLRECGVLQQATAHPLPATMTPAAVTNALFPSCGFSRTPSGF